MSAVRFWALGHTGSNERGSSDPATIIRPQELLKFKSPSRRRAPTCCVSGHSEVHMRRAMREDEGGEEWKRGREREK